MQVWRLKYPEEMLSECGVKSKEARKFIFSSLDEIQNVRIASAAAGDLAGGKCGDVDGSEKLVDKLDRREFVKLLKTMLSLSPELRIAPDAALSHSFISMEHLPHSQFPHSRM